MYLLHLDTFDFALACIIHISIQCLSLDVAVGENIISSHCSVTSNSRPYNRLVAVTTASSIHVLPCPAMHYHGCNIIPYNQSHTTCHHRPCRYHIHVLIHYILNKTQLSFQILRCNYFQEPINFSQKVWRYLHKRPSVVYVLNIQSTMRQHWPNRSSKSTSCWYSRSLVPTVVHVYWPFAQTCLSCFIQPVTALDCMS